MHTQDQEGKLKKYTKTTVKTLRSDNQMLGGEQDEWVKSRQFLGQ